MKCNNGKPKNKTDQYSLEYYLPEEQLNVMAPHQ